MTVNVSKPAINVREKLAELDKPTGIAGEAMLRAETPQEQQALIGVGRRNVLINGDMKISQRGTSFTGVTHGTYTLDRWELNEDSAAEFTITQSSETPDGFGSSVKLDVTTADTSVGSADYVVFEQRIEGYDVQSFASGTSNAKPHTVSFWVRSNVTGTYICELKYDTGGYEASQAYTIDAADTWEYKVLVFPPQTLSAPANDNSAELRVSFWLLAGSNYTGGGTLSTQWTTTDNVRAVGQTNLVASTSNEIYFTGVQLELGKVATPFEHRSYGEELALCQRYYQEISDGLFMINFVVDNDFGIRRGSALFPQRMRTAPSATGSVNDGTLYFTAIKADGVQLSQTGASSISTPTISGLTFDAEL